MFDVEDADEAAYVVMEWVVGESLLDMLAEGPLDPPRAASLVAEAAQAIASAHAAGLTHLRLDPACLHWTAGGGMKITGLGMDAALTGPELRGAGRTDDELTAEDARGAHRYPRPGRLLYAALTGYWPGASRRVRPRPGCSRPRLRPTGCRAHRARCPRACRPRSTP